MRNNEKEFLNNLNESLDNDMNFNDISKYINYEKYKKEKKLFSKKLFLSLFMLISSIFIIISIIPKDNSSLNSGIKEYDGFIKDDCENGVTINDGMQGPLPPLPLVDDFFIVSSSVNDYGQHANYDYIYEIDYTTDLENDYYIGVYLNKRLANKISKECKVILDAAGAGAVEDVNGSIVNWFYSDEYYNKNKVKWYILGNDENKIYSKINGLICVGVYKIQNRTVVREIFNNEEVNLSDKIYQSLRFKNDGNKYLTPIDAKIDYYTSWYASSWKIDESTFKNLANYNRFSTTINKKLDTIELKTYGGLSDEEALKNPYEYLVEFHKRTNKHIISNEYPNKVFGRVNYVVYKYSDYVKELQDLYKVVISERKLELGTYYFKDQHTNEEVYITFYEDGTFTYSYNKENGQLYTGSYNISYDKYVELNFHNNNYSCYFQIKNKILSYYSGNLPEKILATFDILVYLPN